MEAVGSERAVAAGPDREETGVRAVALEKAGAVAGRDWVAAGVVGVARAGVVGPAATARAVAARAERAVAKAD